MKKNNLIIMGVVLVGVMAIVYSFVGQDDGSYEQKVLKQREEKDHFMRTASDSPFAGKVEEYSSLSYFPPDKKYRVTARIIPVENKKMIELGTSDGKAKRYMEYAHAEFSIDGVDQRLLILEVMDMGPYRGALFLAFGDETSARETYGAGRYLDVKKPKGINTITLDFNEAYNPYCAYNETYSCPLPPPENLLTIPIYAGEKNYK